jgi:spore germination cell wall hydrolase CwlJ-like protein
MIEQIRLPFPGKKLDEQEDDILLASLIFLKSRDEIKQAKIGVGCTVRNRVNNPRWWGRNYRQVIVPLLDLYVLSEQKKDLVLNPIKNDVNEKWDNCYLVAKGILNNTIQDITFNSDYFFLSTEKLPSWLNSKFRQSTISQWYVCTFGNIRFYRVELKWNNGSPT